MMVAVVITIVTIAGAILAYRMYRWWISWVNPGKKTIEYAKLGAPRYKDIPRWLPWPWSLARKKMKELWRVSHKKSISDRDNPVHTPPPSRARKTAFNPYDH